MPFSLALRINRICNLPESRDQSLEKLKQFLQNRNYSQGLVNFAIKKARYIHRNIALKKVAKLPYSRKKIAVVSLDTRLPSIDSIQRKHLLAMTIDPYMKEVFPEAPIIAYKRPSNLREHIIRAKLPPPKQIRPARSFKGMKKCQKKPARFVHIKKK